MWGLFSLVRHVLLLSVLLIVKDQVCNLIPNLICRNVLYSVANHHEGGVETKDGLEASRKSRRDEKRSIIRVLESNHRFLNVRNV